MYIAFSYNPYEQPSVPSTPGFDLFHAALLIQGFVHIKAIPEQVRLVSPAPLHAFKLSLVIIIFQNGTILRMRALRNDNLCPLFWTQSSNIRKSLLRNDHIKIVLSLIDMCAHRHNTTQPVWISFRRSRRRCVHNTIFGRSKEICRTAEAVQHARSHHTSTVCVSVDVDFYGCVHSNNAKSPDDLW